MLESKLLNSIQSMPKGQKIGLGDFLGGGGGGTVAGGDGGMPTGPRTRA